jgi:ABC-2 type transport system ATP-binding protein
MVAGVIEIHELTKRYQHRLAVDRLSFAVMPGVVTGFLGPNGAGKTTTIRMLLGLAAPTAGHALVNGVPYGSIRHPLREVGALLDANAVHPNRSAINHLRWLARTNSIGPARIASTLAQVGLAEVARTRVSGFSLGMRQRLGIAAALLGDPGILILDEPVNGLDPQGVRWIRDLMRALAREGRTVLLSSHLMSEMELTADRLVIIGRGRLIADTTVGELIASCGAASLEEAYLRLTDAAIEHRAGGAR